jgi:ribosomal protein S18 acetylase RimI-like enzyme
LCQPDIPLLLETRNLVREWLHNNKEFTLIEAHSWFIKECPEFYIIEVENLGPVGYIRTSARTDESICVGCDIHPGHQRQGYAYRAYYKFMRDLFINQAMSRVWLEVLSHNPAIKLYTKLGFQIETIKKNICVRNGVSLDNIIMGCYAPGG